MSTNRRDGVKIGGRRGFKMFWRRFGQEHLCEPHQISVLYQYFIMLFYTLISIFQLMSENS